jgi:hypothetical protein
MRTMILVVPDSGFVPNRGLRRYPGPSTEVFPSQAFPEPVTKRRPWDPTPPTKTLRVGPDGVAVDDPTGRRVAAVLWNDCVAVVHLPAGRRLLGRDGFVIDIEEAAWQGGRDAVRLVDQYGPTNCVVRVST